jgi:hypothetical protein
MTYGELERTLGHDVIRSMEATLGRAFSLADREGQPEKYDALLELLTALLAASIITKEYEAATRARVLATRLVSIVDQSLSIKETDRRKQLS